MTDTDSPAPWAPCCVPTMWTVRRPQPHVLGCGGVFTAPPGRHVVRLGGERGVITIRPPRPPAPDPGGLTGAYAHDTWPSNSTIPPLPPTTSKTAYEHTWMWYCPTCHTLGASCVDEADSDADYQRHKQRHLPEAEVQALLDVLAWDSGSNYHDSETWEATGALRSRLPLHVARNQMGPRERLTSRAGVRA